MQRFDPHEPQELEHSGRGGGRLGDLAAIALATITVIMVLTALADDIYRLYLAIFVGAR